ncbi:MAG TPA: ABC transporter substrate-binding protein [Ilumatobacteraceae bacterium]|nr:ABC transporter substrate-binding protein [Ilumatobacteraceae bacterium]
MRLPRVLATIAAVSMISLAACGSDDNATTSTSANTSASTTSSSAASSSTTPSGSDAPTTTASTATTGESVPTSSAPSTDAPTTDPAPIEDKIVVIGEEYLLADLLALDVVPFASTATVADKGFQGLDAYDTSGIQILPATTLNVEALATMAPDRIIILNFFANEVGEDLLNGIAPTTVIPDGLTPEQLITIYGEMFDRKAQADALIAELDAARADATAALSGLSVSAATIYSGPSLAAYVSGPWTVPQTLLDAGATLVPDPSQVEPDRNGRGWLSLEQIGLLSAPQLLLFQTETVDGEDAAIEAIEANPLWAQLPAVKSGDVTTFDRLGYPGIEGRVRLIADLIAALA